MAKCTAGLWRCVRTLYAYNFLYKVKLAFMASRDDVDPMEILHTHTHTHKKHRKTRIHSWRTCIHSAQSYVFFLRFRSHWSATVSDWRLCSGKALDRWEATGWSLLSKSTALVVILIVTCLWGQVTRRSCRGLYAIPKQSTEGRGWRVGGGGETNCLHLRIVVDCFSSRFS